MVDDYCTSQLSELCKLINSNPRNQIFLISFFRKISSAINESQTFFFFSIYIKSFKGGFRDSLYLSKHSKYLPVHD